MSKRDVGAKGPADEMNPGRNGSDAGNGHLEVDWHGLLHALESGDGVERVRARYELIALGTRSCGLLKEALHHSDEQVRWEAAKTLASVPCPEAAPELVERLTDEDGDVRWLAAEALVTLGREGLPSLFQALMVEDESVWLRQGAHHVLRGLTGGRVQAISGPVIEAIEGVAAKETIPVAARHALEALQELTVREQRV